VAAAEKACHRYSHPLRLALLGTSPAPAGEEKGGGVRNHQTAFSIFFMPPIYGTNTSGTRMEPSGY
jgi:hypothetical protein